MIGSVRQMPEDANSRPLNNGVFPSQAIAAVLRDGEIESDEDIAAEQVQPSSLDLRLGSIAYRVQASFLPGPETLVGDKIRDFEMHAIDLTDGAVLEKGCVYIVPLMERLRLSERVSAFANPKSSTGRLDVFTRLITDRARRFDLVGPGYHGPLYAEVSPRTFSILVRSGSVGLVDTKIDRQEVREHDSISLRLDLAGATGNGLVGYRAKKHTAVIDVDRVDHYEPGDFWEPIMARAGRGIILNPDDFYILATREAITVPPDHAAEMVAYDTLVGEFRVHYAGFFDPGFGYDPSGGPGSRAVLEVRSHDVPFLLEHEQVVGRLRYERLTDVPDRLYGPAIGSSYQGQALSLSKQFKTVF